jgi:N-acetylmuramoyl-L-alanine amidase
MKFGIDMGHNCPPDTGAVGIKVEDNLTKAVGTKLMAKLSAAGHSVINCTPNSASSVSDSLEQRVNKANNNNVDIFVSIHFNEFNGSARGSEIYALSNAAGRIGQGVLDEIVKLGFTDRGVRDTPKFYVILNTSMPAILIECCFIDSPADMSLFDVDKMAEAIKVGLVGPIKNAPSVTQPGKLKISVPTVLKPSTKQSTQILDAELVDIAVGEYPVVDSRFEENHYWVKWPDSSKGGRDEHFVFAGHGKVQG